MKRFRFIPAGLIAAVMVLGVIPSSFAALIVVTPGHPVLVIDNGSVTKNTIQYDASLDLFTMEALPEAIQLVSGGPALPVTSTGIPPSETVSIRIKVDQNGDLIGGVASVPDLLVFGEVDLNGDGTVDHAGELLTGDILAFGFLEDGSTDIYDFRFTVTGGALASTFGAEVVIRVASEQSTFAGTFTFNFNGGAKGNLFGKTTTTSCLIDVTKQCLVTPPPSGDGLCTSKIAATLLRYTGPNKIGATVVFEGRNNGMATYTGVDLVSGVTTLSDISQNGFTIDARPGELGSKMTVTINGDEEVIHTSCSAIYVAGEPAPLDANTGQGVTKGDPSPNWFVVSFVQKDGTVVSVPTPPAPSDVCEIPAPSTIECTKRPTEIRLLYHGGDCSPTSHMQDAGKVSCSGDAGADTVQIVATKSGDNSKVFLDTGDPVDVQIGDILELTAANAGVNDFSSETRVEVLDGTGSLQVIIFHTSCSQPLKLGDRYGSLEVVGFTNSTQGTVQSGTDVEYLYEITNLGSTEVTGITVEDNVLGTVPGSPIASILPGGSAMLTLNAFIDVDTMNTVTVTGVSTGGGASCSATATAEVTFVPPPPSPVTCSDIKPITALSMIWNGSNGVDIVTASGEMFENVQNGNLITFQRGGSGNDIVLSISGTENGTSKFHVSCSDSAMNGSEDCGSSQGDGKSDDGNFLNLWLFDGMTGENGSFACGVANTGEVQPTAGSLLSGGVTGAATLDLTDKKDKKVKWELTNNGAQDVFITRVSVMWPDGPGEHGQVKKFKLNKDFAKNVLDSTSPTTVPDDKAFESDPKKRKIGDGKTRTLEIVFTDAFPGHSQSDFTITVEFDSGQILSFQ